MSHVSYLTGQRLDLARCAEIARAAGRGWRWTPPTPWASPPWTGPCATSWSAPATSGCWPRTGPASSPTIRRGSATSPPPSSAGTPWPTAGAPRRRSPSSSMVTPRLRGRQPRPAQPLRPGQRPPRPRPLPDGGRPGPRPGPRGRAPGRPPRRGGWVITPSDPAQRAGNVCFLAGDAARLAAGLAERRALVWAPRAAVRVSAHLYNDAADVAASSPRSTPGLRRAGGARPLPAQQRRHSGVPPGARRSTRPALVQGEGIGAVPEQPAHGGRVAPAGVEEEQGLTGLVAGVQIGAVRCQQLQHGQVVERSARPGQVEQRGLGRGGHGR